MQSLGKLLGGGVLKEKQGKPHCKLYLLLCGGKFSEVFTCINMDVKSAPDKPADL